MLKISKFKLVLLAAHLLGLIFMVVFFEMVLDKSFLTNNSGEVYGASFPDLRVDIYAELEAELEVGVHSRNAVLNVRDCGNSIEVQSQQIVELAETGVKTIFVCPVRSSGLDEAFAVCREMGCKIITVGNLYKDEDYVDYAVSSENYEAGRQMSSCLTGSLDHGRILIVGEEDSLASDERIKGFCSVFLRDDGYELSDVVMTNGKSEDAAELVAEKIHSLGKFDAIFAATDRLGMGAYAAVKMNGYDHTTRILTVDGSPDGRNMVKNGKFFASSGVYPSEISKRAMELSFDEEPLENIARIPVRLITKNTITSYDLSKWD